MANLAEKLVNIWKEIKNQPKDIWFFYLFLLTFTLGVRKVLLFFPIEGTFNEYAGAYVYASDIFIGLTGLAWIVSILYTKIVNMSSSGDAISEVIHKIDHAESVDNSPAHKLSTGKFAYCKAFFAKLFHLPRRQAGVEYFDKRNHENCSTWNIFCASSIFLIPLFLIIWSFISVFWSENQTVGIYRCIRFLELYLLYLYVAIRFVPYCLAALNNYSTCLSGRQVWNNYLHSSEIVPRGTISDESKSNNEKLFHLPSLKLRKAGVEHFNYVLSKMAQYFYAILLGLIVIALFDHYLWDIWQGQVLLWLVCGILVGIGFSEQSNSINCSTWNILSDDSSEIVPRGTINSPSLFFSIIVLLGVTQSLIGIAQFILQHSLGLFWLKESLIGPDIAGVAKIIANHHLLIRAYGLFPHPNLLGGFLFFSIMMTMLYVKLFHVEQFKAGTSQEDLIENCSTWNNFKSVVWVNVPRGTFSLDLIRFVLAIQVVGIFLSFSKSAILALIIALGYIIVPRGTISREKIKKMFHVEHFRALLGLGLVMLAGLLFLRVQFYALFVKSLAERGLYLSISERIISESPIIGIGTGQFIFEAGQLFPNLAIWQYQPVHNVFLLIWSEWGIVGLVLFILFLWKLFHVEQFPDHGAGAGRSKREGDV
jgi:hypothetical protein